MNKTWFEEGVETGVLRESSRLRRTVERLLSKRFGDLSASAHGRLMNAEPEMLEQLAENLLDASSLRELGLED